MDFYEVANEIFDIVYLMEEDKEKFLASDVAKAVTMAPYACESDEPLRYAIQNGVTFLAAVKSSAFFANPSDFEDDITKRLDAVFMFPGNANKKDILRCRLTLRMISDMRADADKDAVNGKYNPIVMGHLNEGYVKDVEEIAHISNKEIDTLFPTSAAAESWWWA